jgi:putative acetyltransferase
MMTLQEPCSPASLAIVRTLFEEYRALLGVDLCFQGFDQEIATLPGDYRAPAGRLWLALADGEPAGCVGIRPLADDNCEMKRLYVRPVHRGTGLGRRLAKLAVDAARTIGYRRIYLDTLASMTAAIELYRSLGFEETEPYRHNPVPGALFFALDFCHDARGEKQLS